MTKLVKGFVASPPSPPPQQPRTHVGREDSCSCLLALRTKRSKVIRPAGMEAWYGGREQAPCPLPTLSSRVIQHPPLWKQWIPGVPFTPKGRHRPLLMHGQIPRHVPQFKTNQDFTMALGGFTGYSHQIVPYFSRSASFILVKQVCFSSL